MKKIGIIDVGSNSMRLVIIKIQGFHVFQTIYEAKESVRLGENMNKSLELNAVKINKAIETLKLFKAACGYHNVETILAIATEAVRKASNQKFFLDKVKEITGIDIRVLSGKEEAFYNFFGVINSVDLRDGLIMDIGGCSTELIWVKNRKLIESTSLPFGALALTERFNLQNGIQKNDEKDFRTFLNHAYQNVPWLSNVEVPQLIGVGGTIRNIAKIDSVAKEYPIETIDNYILKASDVLQIYTSSKNKTLLQRRKIQGLSADRADIFVGGAGAVAELLQHCHIKELVISNKGLRDGLLYEHLSLLFQELNS